MMVVTGLIGVVGLLFGFYAFFAGQSAIHEIEGLIGFVIGAVGLGAASVAASVEGTANMLRRQLRKNSQVAFTLHQAEHPELYRDGSLARAVLTATADAMRKCNKCKVQRPHRVDDNGSYSCVECTLEASTPAAPAA